MDGNEPMDGNPPPVLTEEEQQASVFAWMRSVEERLGFMESVFIELLTKLKDAGLIVDEDDDEDGRSEND